MPVYRVDIVTTIYVVAIDPIDAVEVTKCQPHIDDSPHYMVSEPVTKNDLKHLSGGWDQNCPLYRKFYDRPEITVKEALDKYL